MTEAHTVSECDLTAIRKKGSRGTPRKRAVLCDTSGMLCVCGSNRRCSRSDLCNITSQASVRNESPAMADVQCLSSIRQCRAEGRRPQRWTLSVRSSEAGASFPRSLCSSAIVCAPV